MQKLERENKENTQLMFKNFNKHHIIPASAHRWSCSSLYVVQVIEHIIQHM